MRASIASDRENRVAGGAGVGGGRGGFEFVLHGARFRCRVHNATSGLVTID